MKHITWWTDWWKEKPKLNQNVNVSQQVKEFRKAAVAAEREAFARRQEKTDYTF